MKKVKFITSACLLCLLVSSVSFARPAPPRALHPALRAIQSADTAMYLQKRYIRQGTYSRCDNEKAAKDCLNRSYLYDLDLVDSSNPQKIVTSGHISYQADEDRGWLFDIPARNIDLRWQGEQAWLLMDPPVADYSPFCYRPLVLEEGDLESMADLDSSMPDIYNDISESWTRLNRAVQVLSRPWGKEVLWGYFYVYNEDPKKKIWFGTRKLPAKPGFGLFSLSKVRLDRQGRIVYVQVFNRWYSDNKLREWETKTMNIKYPGVSYTQPTLKSCS